MGRFHWFFVLDFQELYFWDPAYVELWFLIGYLTSALYFPCFWFHPQPVTIVRFHMRQSSCHFFLCPIQTHSLNCVLMHSCLWLMSVLHFVLDFAVSLCLAPRWLFYTKARPIPAFSSNVQLHPLLEFTHLVWPFLVNFSLVFLLSLTQNHPFLLSVQIYLLH